METKEVIKKLQNILSTLDSIASEFDGKANGKIKSVSNEVRDILNYAYVIYDKEK